MIKPGFFPGGSYPASPEASDEAKRFFPLMSWGHSVDFAGSSDWDRMYGDMVECGIMVAGFVPVDHLPLCEKHGLAAFVYDPRLQWKDNQFFYNPADSYLCNLLAMRPSQGMLYQQGEKQLEPYGGDATIKAIRGDQPLLVGKFKHADGTDYAMVVNLSVARSSPFELKFSGDAGKLEFVAYWSATPEAMRGEQFQLAPGAGVLLKFPR